MAGFKMKLTVPVINEDWWQKDKNKMLKLVEKYKSLTPCHGQPEESHIKCRRVTTWTSQPTL